MFNLLLFSFLGAVTLGQVEGATLAKNYAGMPKYPETTVWEALRDATGGRLHKCPAGGAGCGVASARADYVLLAQNAQDISSAMKFANDFNLRVTIRNTGHDFFARHSGAGSLAISTQNMKGSNWTANWRPATGQAKYFKRQILVNQPAVSINAGNTWNEVISVVRTYNHSVVHGADPSVGASGGWTQGGGHGPYSNQYGMGCDNALEFEVVTANGEIVIANDVSNPDLFFALRGGGASTFGVVTRTVMKTFPSPSMPSINLRITAGVNGRDGFLDAIAYLIALTPNITDFGMSGYPTMVVSSNIYFGQMRAPGKTAEEFNAFFNPIAARMRELGVNVSTTAGKIIDKRNDMESSTFPDPLRKYWLSKKTDLSRRQELNLVPVHDIPVDTMSSRLLSRTALTESNVPAIRKMLSSITGIILPYPDAGGQVAKNRNLNTGLNPAWRDAVMHMVVINKQIPESIAAMDPLSANHGAYWNEALGRGEKDWKTTFFGPREHYEKLLVVKRKFDPKNTLWCMPCVGGDVFVEGEGGKLYLV